MDLRSKLILTIIIIIINSSSSSINIIISYYFIVIIFIASSISIVGNIVCYVTLLMWKKHVFSSVTQVLYNNLQGVLFPKHFFTKLENT